MSLRLSATYLLLFINSILFSQQFNADTFVVKFNHADIKEKVFMAAKLSPERLDEVYPFIKDSLKEIKQKVYYNTISKEAKCLFDLIDARVQTNNQNHHKAIFILENSLRFHAESLNDSLAVLKLLSPAYLKLRNYNKAFEIEDIFERIKHRLPKGFLDSYSPQKSVIYLRLGMFDKSTKELHHEFSLRSEKAKRDTNILGNYYNDMGVHFNKANRLDSAVYYFNKAKILIDAKGKYDKNKTYYNFFSGLIDGNLASTLAKQKKYAEAIPPLKKDIYYSKAAKNWLSAANSYNLIAECYLELKNYSVARKYIDSCKPLLSKFDELSPALNNILTEAKYYKATGNLALATKNYDDYILYKDSIQKVDNENKLINQQISFDLYQKENQLVAKEKIIQQHNLLYEQEKTKRSYLLLGIIILAFIITILIINNQLNKRRQGELFIKNKHIIQQKNAIESALKEKEFLIKEIHHRVKNNLQIISSMLNLQSEVIENKEAKDVLQESRLRINSMSLIHQMLYNKGNMSSIIMSEYLEALIKQINTSYSPLSSKIKVNLFCDAISIDLDTAIPLGLIVNELVTNSYKHAFKPGSEGIIEVNFKKENHQYSLVVKDNGVGFDSGNTKNTSLGMELIQMLSQQLNGTLSFKNHNGTTAEIIFSL